MKNRNTFKTALPLFGLSLINGGISSVNAVIQSMADELGISLSLARMVSTLPSVIVMFVTMIAGRLVERKLTYKQIIFTGITLFLLGGISPVFIDNIYVILALRTLFGIGLGCFGILSSLYLRTFQDDQEISAKMVGYSWTITSIGAIAMKFAAGVLGDINWHYAFIPYSLGLVSLTALLFGFREPRYTVNTEVSGNKAKTNWTPRLILYVAVQGSSSLLIYPVLTGMSTFLSYRGLGSATLTGIVGSIYTFAGVIMGSIAPKLNSSLKRFMVPVMYCMSAAAGLLLILTARGPIAICLGCFLSGVSSYSLLPTITMYENLEADEGSIPVVTSVTWAVNNLALFLSSYVITFADRVLSFVDSSDAGRCYMFSMAVFAAMALLFTIVDIRPEKLKQKQSGKVPAFYKELMD